MPSLFGKSTKKAKGGRPVIGEPRGVIQHGGNGGHLGKITEGQEDLGEFGALKSKNGSSHHPAFLSPPTSPSASTHSHPPTIPPKYSFSPTSIPHRTSSDNSIDSTRYSDPDVFVGVRPYGFLGGVGAKVVLSLEDVRRVVVDVAKELEERGLATPLLFSNQALELGQGQARGKLLILAYVDMLSSDNRSSKSHSFSNDLQYAKENELAWFLRWALSRICRKKEGSSEVSHGILEWEVYEEWRGRERAANYPNDAFPYLAALIPSPAYQLLQPLFHLLSRLAAHSHLSGLTPHALSSLFAPLLFNVPVSSPALVSHTAFVRAAAATEHLLLAYIRSTSRTADLGLNDLPGRLKEWVTGYPGMVICDNDLVKGLPRKGAKVVRCERATRVVRAYSKDLVGAAEGWTGVGDWEAWERVVIRIKKGVGRPRFTGGYRRRMVLKETPAAAAAETGPTEYGLAEMGSGGGGRGRAWTDLGERPIGGGVGGMGGVGYGGVGYGGGGGGRRERHHSDEEEARYDSLAGKQWSMFEEGGFGSGGGLEQGAKGGFGERLRFDLTEGAKLSLTERRKTMDWTDFASPSGGFTRTDPALTTTLTFSKPLSTSIEQWPKDRSDLSKRLQKSQKDSVPFHHETTLRFGADSGWEGEGEVRDSKGRVYLEEAFVDFWADLGMGGGWIERGELTFRECNWAIMEYKAKPSSDTETHSRDDPRMSSLYFLLEEKVPYDYQFAIANPQEKRAFSMFTRKKKSTSNSLPNLSSLAGGTSEGEFDRMLLNRSGTKKVTLNASKGHEASIWHKQPASPTKPSSRGSKDKGGSGSVGFVVKSREMGQRSVTAPTPTKGKGQTMRQSGNEEEERPSFFSRSRSGRAGRSGGALGAGVQADMVDFELQSTSGVGSPGDSPVRGGRDEDKWMDILVANGARRMDRQDADPPRPLPIPPTSDSPSTPSPNTPSRKSRTPPHRHSPERLPPQIYHSPDASGETDDDLQTPRISTISHHPNPAQLEPSTDAISPIDPDQAPIPPLKRAGAQILPRKPLPLPTHETHYAEGDQHRDSWSSTSDRAGLIAPSPVRGRDTIFNIVDTYRDSITDSDLDDTGRFSRVTGDEMYASDEQEVDADGIERRYTPEGEDEQRRLSRDSVEELASPTKSGVDGEFDPPKLVFDITPTREPSPGRYRHGEALHFVREEPAEEARYK